MFPSLIVVDVVCRMLVTEWLNIIYKSDNIDGCRNMFVVVVVDNNNNNVIGFNQIEKNDYLRKIKYS